MLKIVVTTFSQPHTMNRNVASNNLSKGLHFALLRFVLKRLRLKVVIIRVKEIVTFDAKSCYNSS